MIEFEANVLLFIQSNIRCSFLDAVMRFFSFIGEAGAAWLILAVILIMRPQTRSGGLLMLICLLAGFLLNNIFIKNLVQRPRPYDVIPNLTSILGEVAEWSFPSGHTCSSFACATALTLVFGKNGAWAFIPASLIAVSRIYAGVHYPSDILGGMLVGTCLALLLFNVIKRTSSIF